MSFDQPGYPKLGYSQLEQLWIQAGGQQALAPLMAAIAMAESSGQAGATNPTDNGGTQTSWGLWQISNGTHSPPTSGDPYDPLTNAKLAVDKYKSQGLGAWGTYTSGAYQQYLQGNVPPGVGPIPSGSGDATFTAQTSDEFFNPFGLMTDLVNTIYTTFTGTVGAAKDVPSAIQGVAQGINEFVVILVWLLNPSHWLRIISGLIGLIIIGFGLHLIATS